MTTPTDIHSCSYFCTRPGCVLAQRDEMRAELARLREQEPVAWIQHHKAGDNLVWDDPGGKKSPMYAAAPPAQPAAQPVQRRPALASIESAPACLNMNDKAMWVTGWNECRDAIAVRPGDAS